jgi:DNA-binding beta-propeller fold protein YncE
MSVIDTESNAVVATLDAGRKPWDVTVSRDGSTVYVAASASGEILLFNANDLVVSSD